MNVRFYNAKILTMKEPIEITSGEVWVKGERILYVGTEPDEVVRNQIFSSGPICWDRQIDCQQNLIMPGFKNAHTHSPMVLFRSLADDRPLEQWLQNSIFPIEAKLSAEDIYTMTKLAVMEYVSGGVTSVFDMYFMPLATHKAFAETGMRNVLVSGLNDFQLSCQKIEKLYQTLNHADSLTSFMLGVHAEYTCSLELLQETAKLVSKYQAPFYAHISETQKEVEDCKKRYGKSPVQLFDELGLYEYGGGGYHCIYFDDRDFEIYQKRGLTAVTNPASNLKLASGIAPIRRFLDMKIPVAIGTDGAGSNNCLDMFREMFLVTGLAKYINQDASSVDALEILKMACVNGAHAMGLQDCDVLEKDKYADLILIDLHQPNMQPMNHIAKNLVYSGSKQNVKLTMINGNILYEEGKYFIGDSPEDLYERANQIVAGLV